MNLELAAIDHQLAKSLGVNKVCALEQLTDELAIFARESQQLVLHLTLEGKHQRLAFSLNEGEIANRAAKVSKTNELSIRCDCGHGARLLHYADARLLRDYAGAKSRNL